MDDGTHIIHHHRFAQLEANGTLKDDTGKSFIPAHKNFRVVAIAAPVPPYPGYPLDPPFRSRFQARFIDPVGSLVQTALAKLSSLVSMFPPPPQGLSPGQLARLLLVIHPALVYAPLQAWAILGRQSEEAGLGELGSPSMSSANDAIGIFGYQVTEIKGLNERLAQVTFEAPSVEPVVVSVPAGSRPLHPFPLTGSLGFNPSPRFLGLLTCFLQAHALGWDISLIPSALPSTATTSSSTLVKVFGEILGYETEVLHMYKEMGGRELVMRRKVTDGGATSWEPSPLVDAAWAGRLLHLSGLDVVGATAGSISRLLHDREIELWVGRRIVIDASRNEVGSTQTTSMSNCIDACQDFVRRAFRGSPFLPYHQYSKQVSPIEGLARRRTCEYVLPYT